MANGNQFILTNINGDRELTFKFEEEFLYNILPQFEDFLRGCGFGIDGKLAIVEGPDYGAGPWDTVITSDYLPEDLSLDTEGGAE
jgi:hypothetical protein